MDIKTCNNELCKYRQRCYRAFMCSEGEGHSFNLYDIEPCTFYIPIDEGMCLDELFGDDDE